MLVTKHSPASVREAHLKGHFWIGTLAGYRRMETDNGLLDDTNEGSGTTNFVGDSANVNISLPGMHIEGVAIIGCSAAVSHSYKTDVNVFCSSEGDYDVERHLRIIKGNENYKANPEHTAFVVLDARRLAVALQIASEEYYGWRCRWVSQSVSYEGRDVIVPSPTGRRFAIGEDEMIQRMTFRKPTRFSVEQEFRFAGQPPRGTPIEVIKTELLSKEVQRSFVAAIHDAGADEPRG